MAEAGVVVVRHARGDAGGCGVASLRVVARLTGFALVCEVDAKAWVPWGVVGGVRVHGVQALMRVMAAKARASAPLLGASAGERARVDTWLNFAADTLPGWDALDARQRKAAARVSGANGADVLEACLAAARQDNGAFLAGTSFPTLADVCVACGLLPTLGNRSPAEDWGGGSPYPLAYGWLVVTWGRVPALGEELGPLPCVDLAVRGANAWLAPGPGAATPAKGERSRAVGLVYDARMMRHEYYDKVEGHPEQPARISRIYERLVQEGLEARCVRLPARRASDGELASVHTGAHIADMRGTEKMSPEALAAKGDALDSVYLNPDSHDCALLSCGGVLAAQAAVLAGRCRSAACVVRPPGHHAEAHCAMGFCLYNGVAVAAAVALQDPSVRRVLVVDWDVHHGNGTQHMFEDDPRVLYFSAHRYDEGQFYPCSPDAAPGAVGKGAGSGFSVNVAWNGGRMGDPEYAACWDQVLMPVAEEFNPDLVLVSAGFDAAEGDPLGGCSLTPAGYHRMTRRLMELAGGRVLVCLEGGYNLSSISASMAACVSALLGDEEPETLSNDAGMWGSASPSPVAVVRPRALGAIASTLAAHAPYWACCAATHVTAKRDADAALLDEQLGAMALGERRTPRRRGAPHDGDAL